MKRARATVVMVGLAVAGSGAWPWTPSTGRPIEPAPDGGPTTASGVPGKTQPVPGRMGLIAPAVLHPVTQVLVSTGDRVKAGQPLVRLDADEAEADVRAKRAVLAEIEAGLLRLKAMPREEERAAARETLEAARVAAEAARQCHERFEGLRKRDAISLHQHQESRSALRRAEAEERAARARLQALLKHPLHHEIAEMEARRAAARAELDAAGAELEHYTVVAPIEGVVARLEAHPGMVSRPGTVTWGEILDLREIDVRSEVSPTEADRLAPDRAAVVVEPGPNPRCFSGRVTTIGRAADPVSGRVPVLVRLADAGERLRANLDVLVRFDVPSSPRAEGDRRAAAPVPGITAGLAGR